MKHILDLKCALITGGAGGLGYAMAEWLVKQGKKVIIVGRTESKLQEAAKKLGNDTKYYVLDTGKVADIPDIAKQILKEHPELDCIVNNAGVQRPFDISNFDLAKADQEIDINIRGPMHLAIAFLDHLKSLPDGGVIMNVSSVLGYNPFSILNPVYNGTKAWVHFWSMNLRTQLKDTKVRVVEIVPPTVATDLHRERSDPDDNKKDKNEAALSVEEFMEFVSKGWKEDKDTIGAGTGVELVEKWYGAFGEQYGKMAESYKPGTV